MENVYVDVYKDGDKGSVCQSSCTGAVFGVVGLAACMNISSGAYRWIIGRGSAEG